MNREIGGEVDTSVGGAGFGRGESKFAAFYREHSLWAARLAYLLTADRGWAEDLMQEAFVGLYGRFDEIANPRAYVRVSLVHLASRRRRRERRVFLAQRLVASPELVSDSSNEIFTVVATLPAKQRAVIVLRYVEGLSESEISATLGCAPGTVKSLASRALDRLRKEITP